MNKLDSPLNFCLFSSGGKDDEEVQEAETAPGHVVEGEHLFFLVHFGC